VPCQFFEEKDHFARYNTYFSRNVIRIVWDVGHLNSLDKFQQTKVVYFSFLLHFNHLLSLVGKDKLREVARVCLEVFHAPQYVSLKFKDGFILVIARNFEDVLVGRCLVVSYQIISIVISDQPLHGTNHDAIVLMEDLS